MRGYNGTVMAYGQTGTGKTFTLSNLDPKFLGIIPRSMYHIFKIIAEDETFKFTVNISYVQIYMEMVRVRQMLCCETDVFFVASLSRFKIC